MRRLTCDLAPHGASPARHRLLGSCCCSAGSAVVVGARPTGPPTMSAETAASTSSSPVAHDAPHPAGRSESAGLRRACAPATPSMAATFAYRWRSWQTLRFLFSPHNSARVDDVTLWHRVGPPSLCRKVVRSEGFLRTVSCPGVPTASGPRFPLQNQCSHTGV